MTQLKPNIQMRWIGPLVALIVMLSLWQLLIVMLKLPTIILPSPLQVLSAFLKHPDQWSQATLATLTEILVAYAGSILLGVGTAIIFAQAKWLRASLYPYAIFLKTLPIIAIAPLIILWIGEGFWGNVIIAWIVAFLPILTNTTEGLINVPSNLQDLMHLYGATRWQRLWKLQLPHALPYLVTGCKISSVSCVLGAVVGEMTVGYIDVPGIGNEIFAKRNTDVAFMFAYILLSGVIGITLFGITSWVGDRVLLYWRDPGIGESR
jgi:NitT/TauT family transport system permease protein